MNLIEVALVAVMVMKNMVAAGMATMGLIVMEAILEVAEVTMILAITIFKFWTHEKWKFWRQGPCPQSQDTFFSIGSVLFSFPM